MLLHCWSNTVQIETPVKRSTTLWRCQSKQSISLPTGSCSFVGAHQPNQNSDYRQITAHTILTWSNPHAHMSCRCSWLSGAILCNTPTFMMKFMVISLIIFSPSRSSRSLPWSSATSTRHATLAWMKLHLIIYRFPLQVSYKELDHLLDHHDHHLTPTPPSHTLCSWLSTDSFCKTPTHLFQAISYRWEHGSSFLKKKRAGQHFFNMEVISSDTGCHYLFLLLTVKNGTSGARHENHL